MAKVTIKLEDGDCIHSVRERLVKALSIDSIESNEKYNDSLMEDLAKQVDKIYMNQYLLMVKEIVEVLKEDLY